MIQGMLVSSRSGDKVIDEEANDNGLLLRQLEASQAGPVVGTARGRGDIRMPVHPPAEVYRSLSH
jgi:hypothetical protein